MGLLSLEFSKKVGRHSEYSLLNSLKFYVEYPTSNAARPHAVISRIIFLYPSCKYSPQNYFFSYSPCYALS